MSAANQASLQASLAQCIAAYNKLTIQPRPDGAVDGSANQWTAMRKSLLEEMKMLREQIQAEDAPFEIVTFPADGSGPFP